LPELRTSVVGADDSAETELKRPLTASV
jgi:hypothetical protein